MRELLILGGIDFIISIILILLKIFGVLLISWETLITILILLIPAIALVLMLFIMIIIYNNTK